MIVRAVYHVVNLTRRGEFMTIDEKAAFGYVMASAKRGDEYVYSVIRGGKEITLGMCLALRNSVK